MLHRFLELLHGELLLPLLAVKLTPTEVALHHTRGIRETLGVLAVDSICAGQITQFQVVRRDVEEQVVRLFRVRVAIHVASVDPDRVLPLLCAHVKDTGVVQRVLGPGRIRMQIRKLFVELRGLGVLPFLAEIQRQVVHPVQAVLGVRVAVQQTSVRLDGQFVALDLVELQSGVKQGKVSEFGVRHLCGHSHVLFARQVVLTGLGQLLRVQEDGFGQTTLGFGKQLRLRTVSKNPLGDDLCAAVVLLAEVALHDRHPGLGQVGAVRETLHQSLEVAKCVIETPVTVVERSRVGQHQRGLFVIREQPDVVVVRFQQPLLLRAQLTGVHAYAVGFQLFDRFSGQSHRVFSSHPLVLGSEVRVAEGKVLLVGLVAAPELRVQHKRQVPVHACRQRVAAELFQVETRLVHKIRVRGGIAAFLGFLQQDRQVVEQGSPRQ